MAIKTGKNYRNIKTRTIYRVVGLCTHSESEDVLVLYIVARSGWQHGLGLFFLRLGYFLIIRQLWARPLELFEKKFNEP